MRNSSMFKYLIFILVCFLSIIISCKTAQKSNVTVEKKTTSNQQQEVLTRKELKEPIRDNGAEYLLGKLKTNEVKYTWLNAKFTSDIVLDKKSIPMSGMIRLKRDSIIWISLSPVMGIELARIIITNDSVKVLNRLESTYYIGSFKYVDKIINADYDFDMIQAFLTGNDVSYYENDKFKSLVENKTYLLSTIGRRKIKKTLTEQNPQQLTEDIWLCPETFRISKVKINEFKVNRKFEIEYDDFQRTSEQLFPYKFNIKISGEKNISVDLKYTRVTLDEVQEFPFSIPEKYQRTQY